MRLRDVAGVLACPFLLAVLAASCAPPGAVPTDAGAVAAIDEGAKVPLWGGLYILSPRLARERRRNANLQQQNAQLRQQLDQRAKDVDQLRGEVDQLRQHEEELRTALEHASTDAASAARAAAASTRRRDPGHVDPAEPTPAPEVVAQERARAQAEARAAADAAATAAAQVAELRTALTQEQERRQSAETQLARLKEETSAPPYASDTTTELTAAKQEVSELRTALADERATRDRLAQDFHSLQQQSLGHSAGNDSANAELRAQLQLLQQEKETALAGFAHSLAESQQRAAALEQQLATAHTTEAHAGADDGAVASIRAENAALRARLDEEHQHTEELAAKLRTASRVTDLIFKMQSGQAHD